MKQTFYGIVTEFDCSLYHATKFRIPRGGPLLLECYLHSSLEAVTEMAKRITDLGWVQVVSFELDIPEPTALPTASICRTCGQLCNAQAWFDNGGYCFQHKP